TIADTQNVPDGIVCFARLTLNTLLPAPADGPVTVAVGNTGTEALAAHLAAALAPGSRDNQLLLERQMEAAQLAAELERRTADTAPKFNEARHEKGFTAIEAGSLWSVVPQATPGTAAAAPDAQAREELTLPATLAHQLNAANTLQNDYDRACARVRALRRQLFADWYRYLLCAYPPLESPDPLPDADAVRHYIERRTLPHLEAAVAGAGTLALQTDAAGRVTGATGTPAESAAGRLAAAIGELLAQTAQLNQDAAVTAAKTRYAVSRRSSPRYWLPAEPVVLLAGLPATPSHRHGADGRLHPDGLLECPLLTGTAPAALFPAGLSTLRARIQQLSTSAPGLAFTTGGGRPWNPLLLEWLVELFPATDPDGGDLYGAGYPADYVTRNYRLGGEDTDLRHQGVHFLRDGNLYHGTSILTPGAGRQLRETLARELARRVKPLLMDAFYASLGVPAEGERGVLTRRSEFDDWRRQNAPGLPALPADDGRTATEQVDEWLRGAAGPASAWAQGRSTVLTDFYTARSVAAAQRNETWLHQHLDDFLTWYGEQVADGAEEDDDATPEEREAARGAVAALKEGGLLVALRAAFVRLAATPCLAQSLSGFNDALRMRRQGYQLPVADPLAFPDAQPFVDAVAAAVGGERTGAPQPLDDFFPLRAGALRLDRLRLVDTFGQARDVE
ncbi:MAG TPA: hypothetical protein VEQ60_21345, partial [Longimicrobium sp.]|nr:hypothetical protein [Longimicrobium sp.]